MDLRQILLTVVFGCHWVGLSVLLVRQKRLSLLLPIAVFTLLISTQILRDGGVVVQLGALGPRSLASVLRGSALVLAVPSIGLMVRRAVLERRAKRRAVDARTTNG